MFHVDLSWTETNQLFKTVGEELNGVGNLKSINSLIKQQGVIKHHEFVSSGAYYFRMYFASDADMIAFKLKWLS